MRKARGRWQPPSLLVALLAVSFDTGLAALDTPHKNHHRHGSAPGVDD